MDNEQAMADAAAALTAEFLGIQEAPEAESVEAAAPVADEQPEPVAEAAPVPVAPFELNPDLPEDIARELAEADIDDEVEAEVQQYRPQTDEYGDPVEVDNDLLREKIKLEKRAAYLEGELAKTKQGQWATEAEKFFPLAKHALPTIQATSRRSFLKAAKAEHERILPHVQAYLAEAKQSVDTERSDVKETARAEVAAAWGQPVTGPGSAEIDTAGRDQRILGARTKIREGKGSLANLFSEMMRG